MSDFVIIADTREKTPLWSEGNYKGFSVCREKLDTGDYSIKGYEDLIVVERKANGAELFANFTTDRDRFMREIERLKEYPYRILMIEDDFESLMKPSSYRFKSKAKYVAPKIILSNLNALMFIHNIQIAFVGKKGGRDYVRNTFKKFQEYYNKGFLSVSKKKN